MDTRRTVRALTLDVGHTLLFPNPSLGGVYARVAAGRGIELSPDWAEEAFHDAWRRTQADQDGLIYGSTHQEALHFWQRVVGRMFATSPLAPAALEALVEDLYEAFGQAASWQVNEGLDALLAGCAEAGIRVGILSNWDLRLRSLLDELGISARTDPVVISAEQGVEKPAPGIFRLAAERLGLPAHCILHVGDTWSDDVEGARRAGLQAAWYNPDGRPQPDGADSIAEIRQLPDLLALLGKR